MGFVPFTSAIDFSKRPPMANHGKKRRGGALARGLAAPEQRLPGAFAPAPGALQRAAQRLRQGGTRDPGASHPSDGGGGGLGIKMPYPCIFCRGGGVGVRFVELETQLLVGFKGTPK